MDGEIESSGSWRVRDATQKLCGRGAVDTADTAMPLSASFDVDTCLARLRRDKATVVRDSFSVAAQTVLSANENEGTNNNASDSQSGAASMPPLVEQWQQLQDMRASSMTKVNEMKEKSVGTGRGAKSSAARSNSPKPSSLSTAGTTALMPTSAASSDSRVIVSRAVLCTAASIAFDKLTPAYEGHELDIVDVPQNNPKNTSAEGSQAPTVNMGAVLLQAQTLGHRAASLAETATRRSRRRYEYRRDNALYAKSPRSVFQLSNPFASKKPPFSVDDDSMEEEVTSYPPRPFSKGSGVTEEWKSLCLPRFKAVLEKGSGNAVYCDVEWPTRHSRIAHLLKDIASDETLGPHLIVTTQPNVEAFAQEFESIDRHVRLMPSKSSSGNDGLRVLTYKGSKAQRRNLRQHFKSATGLPDSSFHVLVMSYTDFLKDYLHICQLPYEAVVLDEGFSWMAAAHIDQNSSIGTFWETGIFSTSDQHTGLAGTMQKEEWDFARDDASQAKKACVGLTARHRILTSPSVYAGSRDSRHQGPVPGLIKFLLPHFPDVFGEEWDRSRIETDAPSMQHMRKLASRSIVVYHPRSKQKDLYQLALDGMSGQLPVGDRSQDPSVPQIIQEHTFIEDGKLTHSRRSALSCFGPDSMSWMRYELGMASLRAVLDAMRRAGANGFLCEEIVPASSLTSSGSNGTVSGTMAYRLAVRCGRSFGSEVGLRQHMAGMHAPPGTWLCRTCGVDCNTAPFRTAHERTCGQPPPGAPSGEPSAGADSSGVKRLGGPISVVGKKAKKKAGSAAGAVKPEEKDSDGSFQVPGYRGVFVNPAGKHFVKIGGERLSLGDSNDVEFFDSIEDAAKKHDEIVRERGLEKSDGLNFKEDGSRIVHEHTAPSAASGSVMGGAASSVVPALSVINIKDLPKDVTPLLRDPRQTSRTGGNSKRHVYAYRGVCRQARKGHDRWQSQISFSGTNHYLGTFDSEWDAAAIYAWAHLILYGEEATRKARLEGEEAAAAYEQEKKDIAAGKVVAPPPKPPKKKRKTKKAQKESAQASGEGDLTAAATEGVAGKTPKAKRKRAPKEARASPTVWSMPEIAPMARKAATSIPILAPRKAEGTGDSSMIQAASTRLQAVRMNRNSAAEAIRPLPIDADLRPCAPMTPVLSNTPAGGAMLMGLSPLLFGWNVEAFLSSHYFDSSEAAEEAEVALDSEYGINRYNDAFRTVVQGTVCVIGRANERTERAWSALGLGPSIPLGATVGEIDCNIGGIHGSCGEMAATIAFCPSAGASFQICANNDTDIVTLNGQRITASSGSFPLFNEDVCTVGARVFVFLRPIDTLNL